MDRALFARETRNEKSRPDADGLTGSHVFLPELGEGERSGEKLYEVNKCLCSLFDLLSSNAHAARNRRESFIVELDESFGVL